MNPNPAAETPDQPHRRLLLAGTAAVGGVGLVAASIPFIQSMTPSDMVRSRGAPVEIDVANVAPGALMTVAWRGKPVWIVHRTQAMLDLLGKHDERLRDPRSGQRQQPPYAKNATRSIRPSILVVVGICTHLGCVPTYRPEPGATPLGADWPGGFVCPCHGSRFDLAGRVFRNVPAPDNLEVPPHEYLSATRLVVGQHRGEGR
ncbi:ubiquinol-cytochrome c reductase iron-sulfur subunit (plasmid) [Burkholderia pyrrocinia]|uniref:ubiquinol-cytochrome c reductase iron-sulfur subunit n=1 Tax=Burkholderia pyrrocinia TaxID=60550 RepID=UPI0038B4A5B1